MDESDIILAKNQALDICLCVHPTDFDAEYVKMALKMYKLNLEIDTAITNEQTQEVGRKPSDKQKACPKCQKPIPKTWSNHYECGWKE